MNRHNARAQGYRDGFLCFQANPKMSKPEFENHGLLVGGMYTENKLTLDNFSAGWNSAFKPALEAAPVEHIESRFGFCVCAKCLKGEEATSVHAIGDTTSNG